MQKGAICEAKSIARKPDYDVISQRKEDAIKDREMSDVDEDEEECSNKEKNEDGKNDETVLMEEGEVLEVVRGYYSQDEANDLCEG